VVEPHGDLPRLELIETIVEHRQRGLKPVGLLRRVGDIGRKAQAAGVGIRDEDAVTGLGVGK